MRYTRKGEKWKDIVLGAVFLELLLIKLGLYRTGGDGYQMGLVKLESNMGEHCEWLERLDKYIEECKYSDEKAAAFLLGYLMGKIGKKQIAEAKGEPPIQNKLPFNGAGLRELIQLGVAITESLRNTGQLRSAGYQTILREATSILGKKESDKSWKMLPEVGAFYVIHGYIYGSTDVKDNDKNTDANQKLVEKTLWEEDDTFEYTEKQ